MRNSLAIVANDSSPASQPAGVDQVIRMLVELIGKNDFEVGDRTAEEVLVDREVDGSRYLLLRMESPRFGRGHKGEPAREPERPASNFIFEFSSRSPDRGDPSFRFPIGPYRSGLRLIPGQYPVRTRALAQAHRLCAGEPFFRLLRDLQQQGFKLRTRRLQNVRLCQPAQDLASRNTHAAFASRGGCRCPCRRTSLDSIAPRHA